MSTSKPPKGIKTQGWPENPSKSNPKRFDPSREKHGKVWEGLMPTLDELMLEGKIVLTPVEKYKRGFISHIGMEMSSKYPQRFKLKFSSNKVCFYDKEQAQDLVEIFKKNLPYWGQTTWIEDLGIEIIPAGRK